MPILARLVRILVSAAGVGLITWVGHSFIPVNAPTAGFVYLLLVLVIASTWGFVEAAFCSLLSMAAFNFFFFEPRFAFTIDDPQNWVALASFLATGLIASRLSTEAKRRALEAIEKQQYLEKLYSLGRAILLMDDSESVARQLSRKLAETFDLSAVALYDPRSEETHRAGPQDVEGMERQLRAAALHGTSFVDPEQTCVIAAIRLGSEPIAGLALQGRRLPDSVIQSLCNLMAIGLERAKAQQMAHEAEAAKRSDRLRTTLIDAIAHELKTPLTSIRAATTALLAQEPDQAGRTARMLKIADDEAARMEDLIDSSLEMAQLDSDHIALELEPASLEEVAREVVAAMEKRAPDRQFVLSWDGRLSPVAMDRRLMKLAIKQILDNALKYSPAERPITVKTHTFDGGVELAVTDIGNGIPQQEQARIFERFYRSPAVQGHVPGSGIGLSISRRIVQAHGGELTVRSQPGETTFGLRLPLEHRLRDA